MYNNREKKIVILSYPRSGTHFLYYTLIKNFNLQPSKSINNSIGNIVFNGHDKIPNNIISDEMYLINQCDVIYMLRDPRDAILSG